MPKRSNALTPFKDPFLVNYEIRCDDVSVKLARTDLNAGSGDFPTSSCCSSVKAPHIATDVSLVGGRRARESVRARRSTCCTRQYSVPRRSLARFERIGEFAARQVKTSI